MNKKVESENSAGQHRREFLSVTSAALVAAAVPAKGREVQDIEKAK